MSRRRALFLGLVLLLLAAPLVLWGAGRPGTVPQADREAAPPHSGGPTLDGTRRGDPEKRTARPEDGVVPAETAAEAEAAWVVTGRVVTAEGVPLGGASLRLVCSNSSWREGDVEWLADSREDGTFRLESEDLDLDFSGAPWAPPKACLLVEAVGHVYAWHDLSGRLVSGARLELGDVRLRGTGGAITGRVLGADDAPLTAEIDVEREDEREQESGEPFHLVDLEDCAFEPATGTFTTARLPPGLYRLHLRLEPTAYYVVEHVPAGTADLVVRLAHARPPVPPTLFDVRVRVRYEAFADAPPVPTQAPFFNRDRSEVAAERLAPDDLWLLRGVTPGERPLLVYPSVAAWGPTILSDLAPDGAVREVLLPRGRTLRGIVRLEGKGVPARVQVSYALGAAGALPHAPQGVPAGQQRRHDTVDADADGRFSFSGLPPGTVSLRVQPVHGALGPPFHWWGWRDVPLDPEGEVLLDVERLVPLVLELTWPEVEPRAAKPPDVWAWRHVENATGSQLDVEDVAWDGAHLVVRLPRPETSKPIDVVLRTSETWALLRDLAPRPEAYRAALMPCARIEGRVLGPEGEPQPGASVSARYVGSGEPAADRYPVSARCDDQGRFVLRPTLPGSYVLHPGVPWDGLAGIPLEVPTGAVPVTLRLAPARWLVGRIVGREGAPLPEAWVKVLFPGMGSGDAESQGCTDDGFFRIAAPADRDVTLRARDFDDRVLGELHVARDGPSVDLRLLVSAAR